MDKKILTLDRLRELLHYDPETGIFEWKAPRQGREIGKPAGSTGRSGYSRIHIDYVVYYSHRLAWLYFHGEWPEGEVDHINRIKSDNRISNLRDVSKAENMQNMAKALSNSRSGLLGAFWCSQKDKWQAVIVVNGKAKHLGFFDEKNDAHAAYMAAKRLHHHAFHDAA